MADINIPEEYLAFDYGFSGVDSPEAKVQSAEAAAPQQPVIDPELGEKVDTLASKVDSLTKLMYRLEESKTEDATEAQLKDNIRTLETIIVPLLNNLLKTADKDYIYWPNRSELIKKHLQKVLDITRNR